MKKTEVINKSPYQIYYSPEAEDFSNKEKQLEINFNKIMSELILQKLNSGDTKNNYFVVKNKFFSALAYKFLSIERIKTDLIYKETTDLLELANEVYCFIENYMKIKNKNVIFYFTTNFYSFVTLDDLSSRFGLIVKMTTIKI